MFPVCGKPEIGTALALSVTTGAAVAACARQSDTVVASSTGRMAVFRISSHLTGVRLRHASRVARAHVRSRHCQFEASPQRHMRLAKVAVRSSAEAPPGPYAISVGADVQRAARLACSDSRRIGDVMAVDASMPKAVAHGIEDVRALKDR